MQSCSSRVVAKGTALYNNASWDLVDASLEDGFQWESLRDSDLPESLRSLSLAERQAFVRDLRAKREGVQERITQVSEARELFLRGLRREQVEGQGLDSALRAALIQQAGTKGFACDGC